MYSWQCDTGCFANGMTMQAITPQLTDTNSGVINCSVTIDGDEYMNDITFYLQITESIKVPNYNYVLFKVITYFMCLTLGVDLCKYLTFNCALMYYYFVYLSY